MNKQKGLTFIGFVMLLAILGFFAYAAMRLVPIYTEYFAVKSAMKAVAAESGSAEMQPGDIRNKLIKRFDVSYVTSVNPNDIRVRRDRNPSITIAYEVRKPFISNVDLVVSFSHTQELSRGAGY
ncbi:MAG: DUF4845 domain-containing protein [Xanthomonadaceae bacterium]|jgi:hypothetical protein|nr:DUF4845 domain-containing protein [Xanthomonadaceae bacterium]MDP2184077.1 DUF4845 domain-containing protein [Xanthomonadales bacterium]MDZ4115724.1 DUF4845 domain-containing protein [Xanthomonadaceae bacterium]MDZ4379133.1 DUF4845 domain-containing protein [Xanthomonadaceae bacterium]